MYIYIWDSLYDIILGCGFFTDQMNNFMAEI